MQQGQVFSRIFHICVEEIYASFHFCFIKCVFFGARDLSLHIHCYTVLIATDSSKIRVAQRSLVLRHDA